MEGLLKQKPKMKKIHRQKNFETPREVYNHLCNYLAKNYKDMDGDKFFVPFDWTGEFKNHDSLGTIDFKIEFTIKRCHPDGEWMAKAMPRYIAHLIKWYINHHNDDLSDAVSFDVKNYGEGVCMLFFSYDKNRLANETLIQCIS